MSELYKITGKFQGYEEKVITSTFTARRATFRVDNTWDGGKKGRLEDVPFEVWGASLDVAKNSLKFDQEAEISFRVGGNKGFVKLSASQITPGKETEETSEIKF